ncbi:hypothetical protein ABPG75_002767 [Micractinium tetrahymenae]
MLPACLDCVTRCVGNGAAATGDAATAAQAALSNLHSSHCRLAHWPAAGGGQHLPQLQACRLGMPAWLVGTHDACAQLAKLVSSVHGRTPDGSGGHSRNAQAMALATLAAVCTLAAGLEEQLRQQPHLCITLASSLARAAAMAGPTALDGSLGGANLLGLLHSIVQGVPQGDARARDARARDARHAVLQAASTSVPLCAGLLSSGTLAALVKAEQAASTGRAAERAAKLLPTANLLLAALWCLLSECRAVRDSSGVGSQGGGGEAAESTADHAVVARIASAADAVGSAVHREGRTLLQARSSIDLPALLRRLAPPAEALAAALQDWWALPEQVAAAWLEAAQAAAARSCANLRCPNLGLEGGAAAGEGAGCTRCAGCRVLYYCGMACQRADWRAGHRKVCGELAAERRRRRRAQRQQQLAEEQQSQHDIDC